MNAPKLVSIIVVIALAAYMLYPTIDSAIPKEINGPPFEFSLGEEPVEVTVDNDKMTFSVKMPSITFVNNLPQDFKEVSLEVFVGTQASRISAGTFDFGTIPAAAPAGVTKEFDSNDLPLVYFMSYVGVMNNDSGAVDLPIILKVAFQYMEWEGTQLLDLSLTIRTQGTADDKGTVEKTEEGNKSTIVLECESGVVKTAISKMKETVGDNITVTAGDATFSATVDSAGKLTVVADGGSTMNAYRALLKMSEDNGGKLTFKYGTKDISVEGEQAQAVLNAVKMFYSSETEAS